MDQQQQQPNQLAEDDGGGGGGGLAEDEYEQFESADAMEDEAPESVQAIHPAQQSPWATYPDLLRVQTSAQQNAQSVDNEDDPPEGQPISFSHRLRQSVQHANGVSNNHSNNNSSAIGGRDTGAIPKARIGAAPPPDVAGPSSAVCNSSAPKQPADVVPSSARNALPQPVERVSHLEREVIALQTQRAVLQQQINQKDNQLRDMRYEAQRCEPVASSLASVAASVTAIQQNMESMAREVSSRLDRLESRLNKLTVVETQTGAHAVSMTGNLRQELLEMRDQQRQDVENERVALMLALSDALRSATTSTKSSMASGNQVDGGPGLDGGDRRQNHADKK